MFLRFDDEIINTDHIIRAYITKAPNGELDLSLRCVSNGGDQATYLHFSGDKAKEVWYELSVLCNNQLKDDET